MSQTIVLQLGYCPVFQLDRYLRWRLACPRRFFWLNTLFLHQQSNSKGSYQILRRLTIQPGELLSATVAIQHYDGTSDFGIYVNGYRLFGSSSNCVMVYQCKKASDSGAKIAFEQIQALMQRTRRFTT
jgi:hypothetical protein